MIEVLRLDEAWRELVPVVITGGLQSTRHGRSWHVPKRELMSGLQVASKEPRCWGFVFSYLDEGCSAFSLTRTYIRLLEWFGTHNY